MKIGFVSLGCPKNQLDTEVMLHEVLEAGYEITPEDIDADVIIVNTCAFIESAKKEAIDNILDVAWLKKNRHLKAIIVTGCLAERYGEEIFRELPEVDAVVGTTAYDSIAEVIGKALGGERSEKLDDLSKIALPQGEWELLLDGESSFRWKYPAHVAGEADLEPVSLMLLGRRA